MRRAAPEPSDGGDDGADGRGRAHNWRMHEVAAWGRARLAADDDKQQDGTRQRFEKARQQYGAQLDHIMEVYKEEYPWDAGKPAAPYTLQMSKASRIPEWGAGKAVVSKKKAQEPPAEKKWKTSKAEGTELSVFYAQWVTQVHTALPLIPPPLPLFSYTGSFVPLLFSDWRWGPPQWHSARRPEGVRERAGSPS